MSTGGQEYRYREEQLGQTQASWRTEGLVLGTILHRELGSSTLSEGNRAKKTGPMACHFSKSETSEKITDTQHAPEKLAWGTVKDKMADGLSPPSTAPVN